MSIHESRLDNLDSPTPSGHGQMSWPGVPGLIEGVMSIQPEPGGSVSFRVIIGADGQSAKCDLLELIIGADDIANLSRALAGHYAGGPGSGGDEAAAVPPFPCHVGLRRDAEYAAA